MNSKALVLVVDDEPDLLDLLGEQMETLGADVLKASDGSEALKIVNEQIQWERPVDAILSDINMAPMNGLTFLSEVRERGIDTPFVILSGYGDRQKTAMALRLGAFDFLDKPCDMKHLNKVMTSAMDLGVALRDLNLEVEEIVKNVRMPAEQADQFRQAQKKVLFLKRQSNVLKVKKVG